MRTMADGLLFINFGEPDEPTLEKVTAFLERIFMQNASLEDHEDEAAVARTRELARRRAPGLLEEYQEIGGSPLNAQSEAQAHALAAEFEARGMDVRVYSCFQFTEPSIRGCVAQAREDGVERLFVLPGYPLCGESTTVAAIRRVHEEVESLGWQPQVRAVAGWHHDPRYRDIVVRGIRDFVEARGLDLTDPDTLLYFSMHGTPIKYLEAGNRYDRYVEEHCRSVAAALGTDRYAVGFQNHANRGIVWTRPDNEDLLREITEARLVVAPISFAKEQSETLAELDGELREFVEELGKEFHRVPVPHDDPALPGYLADLVAELMTQDPVAGGVLGLCRCSPNGSTWCTNGHRDLPESPFVQLQAAGS